MNPKTISVRIGLALSLVALLLLFMARGQAGAFPSPQTSSPWEDAELRGKIDPILLKQLVTTPASLQPVIVEMKTQTNLESATRASAARLINT